MDLLRPQLSGASAANNSHLTLNLKYLSVKKARIYPAERRSLPKLALIFMNWSTRDSF